MCCQGSDTSFADLFECDNDVDLACELAPEIAGAEDGLEHDVLCSFGHLKFPGHDGTINNVRKAEENSVLGGLRQKLDAGLGDTLFTKYRGLAEACGGVWGKHEAQYKFIILGALMMGTGAKINDHDIQHLRHLASVVQSNEHFTLAFADTGFRGPSKRQFFAALDNYHPGTPRDYSQPCCHACGKSRQDTAKPLLKCSGCMDTFAVAWFCGKVSHQRAASGMIHS